MELVWLLYFIHLIALLLSVLATQEQALGSTRHSVFAGVRLTPRKPSESMSVRFTPSLKVEKSLAQVLISAVESSLTQGSQHTQTYTPCLLSLSCRSAAGVPSARSGCECRGTDWVWCGPSTALVSLSSPGCPEGLFVHYINTLRVFESRP